jgi:ADP-heptose:LPS heptosyltransferase
MKLWKSKARLFGAAEIIGVVPQCSSFNKEYPVAKWASAIARLWNERFTLPALIGGPGDVRELDKLALSLQFLGIPFVRMQRPLSVLGVTALLARMDGVLSVDTGLAHLAVAQHIPTVVLVSGAYPGRFFPWPNAPHHVALNIQMPCDRCRHVCMQSEPLCITQIVPDDIVAAFVALKTGQVPTQLFPKWTSPLQAAG